MRICIFGSEIGLVKKGVFVGGSTVSAVRLGQALHKKGNDVLVLSSAPRGRPSGHFTFEWGTVENWRIPGRYMSLPYLLFYLLFSFFGLMSFCKKNKVDIISTHAGSYFLSTIPAIVGRILHLPVIHTQYCELFVNGSGVRDSLIHSLVKITSRYPKKFVGISRNVCFSLIRAGVPSLKVKLILPIVPIQDLTTKPDRKYLMSLGFGEEDFVVLFVGNLKKNKGLDVLFDSFVSIASEYPNLRLLVTTELKHQNFLERKAMLERKLETKNLVDRVVWLGFVDNMIGLIRSVSVVVVPFLDLKGISDYPLVVLEAMSVGTPVIATSVGGTPEVLNADAGVLVPPGDIGCLVQGLKTVILNGSFTYAKNAGLTMKGFNESVIGNQFYDLFKDEVAKR